MLLIYTTMYVIAVIGFAFRRGGNFGVGAAGCVDVVILCHFYRYSFNKKLNVEP